MFATPAKTELVEVPNSITTDKTALNQRSCAKTDKTALNQRNCAKTDKTAKNGAAALNPRESTNSSKTDNTDAPGQS